MCLYNDVLFTEINFVSSKCMVPLRGGHKHAEREISIILQRGGEKYYVTSSCDVFLFKKRISWSVQAIERRILTPAGW